MVDVESSFASLLYNASHDNIQWQHFGIRHPVPFSRARTVVIPRIGTDVAASVVSSPRPG
jgi:hypothetical protein